MTRRVRDSSAVRLAVPALLTIAILLAVTSLVSPPVARSAGDPLRSVLPARLMDSRPGQSTVDGQFLGFGRVGAGSVTTVTVLNRGGVPGDASAVMLNVTAVFPSQPGYLTVFPCGEPTVPTASNVNFGPGVAVAPNAVLAKVGVGGQVCVYSLVASDLVIDVNGYVPAGGSPASLVPARVFDSRPGHSTVDGQFLGSGQVGAGSVTAVTVLNRGGVPAEASAVMLNVTAVSPSQPGFLTVFPCGQPTVPTASNVNFGPGIVVAPNAVLAKVGAGGQVCVYSLVATDLVIDVNGYVPTGSSPASLVPARLLETRPGFTTVDGQHLGRGRVAAGSVTEFVVWGRGGVTADASAVMLNVTAVLPSAPGFLTVFPCGGAPPNASNVNYGPGVVVSNAVLARVGTGGKVCVYSRAATDLVVDVNSFAPFDGTPPLPPVVADTLVPPSTTLAPPAPPVTGPYSFVRTLGGQPYRWDPCQPVTYAIDPSRATASDVATFHAALAVLEQATGLDFVYVGSFVATFDADGLPEPNGDIADVTVSFVDATVGPEWVGPNALGVTVFHFGAFPSLGEVAVTIDNQPPPGVDRFGVWLHELGHAVGLGHVFDPVQIMYPSHQGNWTQYWNGDREGLWRVGAAQGCAAGASFDAPAPAAAAADAPVRVVIRN